MKELYTHKTPKSKALERQKASNSYKESETKANVKSFGRHTEKLERQMKKRFVRH